MFLNELHLQSTVEWEGQLSAKATIRQYEWSWLVCGDSRSCFDGASAIKTAPMFRSRRVHGHPGVSQHGESYSGSIQENRLGPLWRMNMTEKCGRSFAGK